MKSDREVDLEFGIEQRDTIIRELLRECQVLHSVARSWVYRGLPAERAKRGIGPLGSRLTRAQQRIVRKLRG